jgi:putative transposase
MLVDTEGLLIAVQVTAAHVPDQRQVYTLVAAGKQRSPRLQVVWVDQGYQDNHALGRIADELQVQVKIVAKPSGKRGFQLVPRRWVVERTFAWLGRYRRLSKDYEYHTHTSETLIMLAMSMLMLKRLAREG